VALEQLAAIMLTNLVTLGTLRRPASARGFSEIGPAATQAADPYEQPLNSTKAICRFCYMSDCRQTQSCRPDAW
jgi:hypothetical protein